MFVLEDLRFGRGLDAAGQKRRLEIAVSEGLKRLMPAEQFAIQRSKIVSAINGMGADVVALEEVQNNVEYGETVDTASGRRSRLNASRAKNLDQTATMVYWPLPDQPVSEAPAEEAAPAERPRI